MTSKNSGFAEVKSLEHGTLKVPYEILNKKFRSAQKVIEREVANLQTMTNQLEASISDGLSMEKIRECLTGVEERIHQLKRKAGESIEDEAEAARACKRRLEHLKQVEHLSPPGLEEWKKKRLERLLVEYFLRSGFYNTALKVAKQSQIQDLTNIDIFLVSRDIEESLARGDTALCLNWCNENRSKLRRLKCNLEFNVRRQEFVELVRRGLRVDAVVHARKHFSKLEADHIPMIKKVMALLAFSVNSKAYQEIMRLDQWQHLKEEFRQANFKLYQLNEHSIFSVTLQAGLSALKTSQCYQRDEGSRNKDCPVCSQQLNHLGRNLPYAHCAQSRLICCMSGKPLNENNPPMVLPNGRVYGFNALEKMASENSGSIICPRTKEIFTLDQAEKVFVM